jgi:hypothetical protein
MCTLTIIPNPNERFKFSAIMNRDELRIRSRALSPVDTDSGGTWTGANEYGLIGFLLNRTHPDDPIEMPTTSRRLHNQHDPKNSHLSIFMSRDDACICENGIFRIRRCRDERNT